MRKSRFRGCAVGFFALTLTLNTPNAFGQVLSGTQAPVLLQPVVPTTCIGSFAWAWFPSASECLIQSENRRYTTVSNVIATKADATNSSISNVR
jgi:hypothetical protein